jgi:hypothetical protein
VWQVSRVSGHRGMDYYVCYGLVPLRNEDFQVKQAN